MVPTYIELLQPFPEGYINRTSYVSSVWENDHGGQKCKLRRVVA